MSNVLIGIIGVLLFIGLALAGALLLGDDFKAAGTDTKAAAVVQAMSQTTNAVEMYKLKTGGTLRSNDVTSTHALIPRFLKAAPVNPVTKLENIRIGDLYGGASSGTAMSINVPLGSDDLARNVCESIQRQTGQIAPTASFDARNGSLASSWLATQPTSAGCIRLWNGEFYGYHRL